MKNRVGQGSNVENDEHFKEHLKQWATGVPPTALKFKAMDELTRAMRSGRVIAFTGSWATVEFGYPDWAGLLRAELNNYFNKKGEARKLKSVGLLTAANAVNKRDSGSLVAQEFLLSAARLTESLSEQDLEGFLKDYREDVAKLFKGKGHPKVKESTMDRIVNRFGIRRIITLNYDIEAEFSLSAQASDRTAATEQRWTAFDKKWTQSVCKVDDDSEDRATSPRVLMHLPDGNSIVSDSFSRERTDRLFEFALGSSYIDGHVMHLHGRSDAPYSLIITQSDYDNLYRRSSLTKLPFEHAMRALFAGNPILFIGLGLSEDEVLYHLRNFVSDGRPHNLAPHFVLWSPQDERLDSDKSKEQTAGRSKRSPKSVSAEDELRRMRWYRQYGIYTIFDVELEKFDQNLDVPPEETEGKNLSLNRSLYQLAHGLVDAMKPFEWQKHHFRTMEPFLKAGGTYPNGIPKDGAVVWQAEDRYNVWYPDWTLDRIVGPVSESLEPTFVTKIDDGEYLSQIIDRGAPIKAWLDIPGSGHGYVAQLIRKLVLERESRSDGLPNVTPTIYAQINAGFSWEIDTTIELISGLYDGIPAFVEGISRLHSFEERLVGRQEELERRILIVINGADRFFDPDGYPLSADLDNLIRLIHQFQIKFTESLDRESVRCENPITLFLFGTGRVSRYLANLKITEKQVSRPALVDFYGSLQQPFQGEKYRRAKTDEARRVERFGAKRYDDPTVTDCLEFAFEQQREINPDSEFPLLTEVFNLDFHAEKFGSTKRPSGSKQFRSAYLRSTENELRKAIHKNDEEYALLGIHSNTLERDRKRGPRHQRQAFFDAYLNTITLAKALNSDAAKGAQEAELGLAILQTMAFVGQPVEVSTLIHCPLVAKFEACHFDELSQFMRRLYGLGLVALMKRYPDNLDNQGVKEPDTGDRYGLHRALLHEIRDRYTVPLSDARTYTSFNIPLFAAQPIDDSEPSDETYDQLEGLIKGLIGAPWDEIKRHEYVYGMRLRAAAASMRSYYTASALLMHEPAAAPSEVPSTRLTDHARLVEQLIKAFELNSKERFKEYPAADAPRCVFPDDLVWMHDQRGVTLLAQGDLYEARYSFSQARHINAQFIERSANNGNNFEGVSGQNWRRIILNEIHVDIERGKISDAEDKIRSFEQSIEDLCLSVSWQSNPSIYEDKSSSNSTAIDEILARYATEINDHQRQVDAVFPAEAILGVALAAHYKGWCAFLSGKIKTAETILERAVTMLCNLGEQRAYANSLRLLASIQRAMGNLEGARKSIRLCLAAADAGRQMDISHHAWIARCELDLEGETERGVVEILKQLNASLRYATLTDMFRVKMEARMVLAKMRMSGGDYDGALEHASDALALAMRFGFALRKVTLRIMIGEILVQRGDPYSGRSMLDQAMQEADRIGYQRAVEKVHQVQLKYFG